MADYIYNPAESIKQGFQQTQAGIGNIFAQVLQQQHRDYTMAESAFQNIEALKKDVNIFGQKAITSKSNELLKQAGAAILKDGKLDYSKLGEIRQGISDIKDLKAGYDVGAKEYERMLQLGIANKDNLVSFEKFYKDLSAKMGDENLVKNPQDLQRAMADTYSNNLDSFKMYGKSFLGANPYQKVAQDVKDPKTGALMRVQAELPTGWTIDAAGNKIPPAPKTVVVNGQTITMDYVDQELARLKSTNPDMLDLMKKQAGFAGQTMSEKDLVKSFIDRIPTTTQATQVKSEDEIRAQKAQATKLESDARFANQINSAQLEGLNLQNKGRKLQNTGQDLENQTKQLTLDSMKTEATNQENPNEIYFPSLKGLVIPQKDGKEVVGKSPKISFDPSRGLLVSVLKDKDGAYVTGVGETDGVPKYSKIAMEEIPKSKLASFKQSVLSSALSGVEKDQKPIIKSRINAMFNKAEKISLSDNLLGKLTPAASAGKLKKAVRLSDIKNAVYESNAFPSVDEGVAFYLKNNVPVIRN